METGRIGVPHGEMSKEAQTAMWTQHQQYHDSGIMSGVTTTAHSVKGDEDDDYMKTSHMQFEWETGFSDQEMHAMNEQFVSTRRFVTSCGQIEPVAIAPVVLVDLVKLEPSCMHGIVNSTT